MNSKDDDKDTAISDGKTDVAPAPEPARQAATAPPAVQARRPAAGIAWLALFLSLVSAAAIAYVLVHDWRERDAAARSEQSLSELGTRVTSSSQSLASLESSLADLARTDESLAQRLDALRNDFGERVQLLDSLPPRLANLENGLSALQGSSADARRNWLLAEAGYYLQIANAQLQLAGNPPLAALALQTADERIAQLADPGLTEVRRAIADELAALEAMEKPDIEGVTLTLSSLARVVDGLPLKSIVAADADAAEPEANLSGTARAWASVKNAFAGLVKISGPDRAQIPFMTPDAEYFLRTNLALQLDVARLALLRGEQAVFQQSLDDATDWLREYFDAGSTPVQSAVQTIDEIRSSVFAATAPDISESLRLLRQFQVVTEPAQ
jgi:uroporphyrin-III C-methyltransferase